MVRWLKSQRFIVFPLSLCELSRTEGAITSYVKPENVLLASCISCKGESSWFVFHDNFVWHNFDGKELSPLFFLNHPIRSAYVISHPKWLRARKRRVHKDADLV